jgi:hypothetical protein
MLGDICRKQQSDAQARLCVAAITTTINHDNHHHSINLHRHHCPPPPSTRSKPTIHCAYLQLNADGRGQFSQGGRSQ